ncbi:MAG: hypothetical protein ABIJ57_15915 [Pseudomonadota bacterium]
MRAQVTLTSPESKKLIAKAVVSLDNFKRALHSGLIAIHPSSTTAGIYEELTGEKPKGVWVCGLILPKGTCISWERQRERLRGAVNPGAKEHGAEHFRYSWFFKRGALLEGVPLGDILAEMKPGDIYVKAPNAIDSQGKVGVLYVSKKAGTLGKAILASKRKKFDILLPTNLEKMVFTPISEAAKATSRTRIDSAMGIPAGLMPVHHGRVVTEIDAIRILTGAKAFHIASGGLGGAEGSVTLVVQGTTGQVRDVVRFIESVKGAKTPRVRSTDCCSCTIESCHRRLGLW